MCTQAHTHTHSLTCLPNLVNKIAFNTLLFVYAICFIYCVLNFSLVDKVWNCSQKLIKSIDQTEIHMSSVGAEKCANTLNIDAIRNCLCPLEIILLDK